MGRSGQIVKPCWLVAGGVALVVRNWWRGCWLGLFFRHFLTFLVGLGKENQQNRRERPTARKNTKTIKQMAQKFENTFCEGTLTLPKIKFFETPQIINKSIS